MPFLFVTYLIMEYIEHKMQEHSKKTITKAGKWGPLLGGAVGIVPQCGFSASATSLYATRVITLGTLIAVYLSTSDEMLPVFISEAVPIATIVKILFIKFIIGVICGFIIDFIARGWKKYKKKKCVNEVDEKHECENKDNESEDEYEIEHLCEHEHCHCEKNGIFLSAVKHTLNILIYIFIITFFIGALINFIGEENIERFIGNHAVFGPIFSSLVGLIPNCAASVIITNLYIKNIISSGAMIAGLLTGAGVGLVVLFRTNKSIKQNLLIISLLYGIGVFSGIIIQLIGIPI